MTGEEPRAVVWGRDDLTCPVPARVIAKHIRHAYRHPWRGDTPLLDPRHCLDTTAITEPGRAVRIMFSLDYGYHASGWFANSDFDKCLHMSVSHPRPDVSAFYRHEPLGVGTHRGMGLETPTDDEVRAWGRVLYREHAPLALFEPAASPLDPYRAPNVVHLRLWLDQAGQPVRPVGEVYHLRPWEDGTSPRKITEGRAGADVR